jgi:hypothetical protein
MDSLSALLLATATNPSVDVASIAEVEAALRSVDDPAMIVATLAGASGPLVHVVTAALRRWYSLRLEAIEEHGGGTLGARSIRSVAVPLVAFVVEQRAVLPPATLSILAAFAGQQGERERAASGTSVAVPLAQLPPNVPGWLLAALAEEGRGGALGVAGVADAEVVVARAGCGDGHGAAALSLLWTSLTCSEDAAATASLVEPLARVVIAALDSHDSTAWQCMWHLAHTALLLSARLPDDLLLVLLHRLLRLLDVAASSKDDAVSVDVHGECYGRVVVALEVVEFVTHVLARDSVVAALSEPDALASLVRVLENIAYATEEAQEQWELEPLSFLEEHEDALAWSARASAAALAGEAAASLGPAVVETLLSDAASVAASGGDWRRLEAVLLLLAATRADLPDDLFTQLAGPILSTADAPAPLRARALALLVSHRAHLDVATVAAVSLLTAAEGDAWYLRFAAARAAAQLATLRAVDGEQVAPAIVTAAVDLLPSAAADAPDCLYVLVDCVAAAVRRCPRLATGEVLERVLTCWAECGGNPMLRSSCDDLLRMWAQRLGPAARVSLATTLTPASLQLLQAVAGSAEPDDEPMAPIVASCLEAMALSFGAAVACGEQLPTSVAAVAPDLVGLTTVLVGRWAVSGAVAAAAATTTAALLGYTGLADPAAVPTLPSLVAPCIAALGGAADGSLPHAVVWAVCPVLGRTVRGGVAGADDCARAAAAAASVAVRANESATLRHAVALIATIMLTHSAEATLRAIEEGALAPATADEVGDVARSAATAAQRAGLSLGAASLVMSAWLRWHAMWSNASTQSRSALALLATASAVPDLPVVAGGGQAMPLRAAVDILATQRGSLPGDWHSSNHGGGYGEGDEEEEGEEEEEEEGDDEYGDDDDDDDDDEFGDDDDDDDWGDLLGGIRADDVDSSHLVGTLPLAAAIGQADEYCDDGMSAERLQALLADAVTP